MGRGWPRAAAARGKETAGSCWCGIRAVGSVCEPWQGILGWYMRWPGVRPAQCWSAEAVTACALVGGAERGVRADAKGASGDDPAAPGESRWGQAGQLRG